MDTEKALEACQRMWRRVGTLLSKKAVEHAEKGHRYEAVRLAEAAEACFWQATGEMDAADIDRALGREAQP
jgi:hypothetical protein